jgi:hypothetical protein
MSMAELWVLNYLYTSDCYLLHQGEQLVGVMVVGQAVGARIGYLWAYKGVLWESWRSFHLGTALINLWCYSGDFIKWHKVTNINGRTYASGCGTNSSGDMVSQV